MSRKHGITADTYKRFIIDSGAVYTGFTGFASLGTLIGATRGGNQFIIEQGSRRRTGPGERLAPDHYGKSVAYVQFHRAHAYEFKAYARGIRFGGF